MKQRWNIIVILLVLSGLVLVFVLPTQAMAQTCEDPFEPDGADVPWIGNGESQLRWFCPEGDVDQARFRVKAGHWYDVHTYDLGNLVDTVLAVEGVGLSYEDDDGGSEPLASRLYFEAPATGDVIITIVNGQGVYSATQSYNLYAGEAVPPTPTPTPTPSPTDTPTPTSVPTSTPTWTLTPTPTPTPSPTDTPTPTPVPTSTPTWTPTPTPTHTPQPTATSKPTHTPPPTATPPMPIVNFSALPDRVDKPGDCVTLRWHVERASEVFLVYPNGAQEGVIGEDERQVCPVETSVYSLIVNAPGGDQTVDVEIIVPLPTHTPTPRPTASGGGSSKSGKEQGTVHVLVFVDENRSETYDPQEGVLGAAVFLMSQADPARVWTHETDTLGQVHFDKTPSGSYTLLIPHLGHAETVTFRGEDLTLDVLVEAIQLPALIP